LGVRLGSFDSAPGLALGLLDAGSVQPLGLGLGVRLLALPQDPDGGGADGQAHDEQEYPQGRAHAGPPATGTGLAAPAPIAFMTAFRMASTRSGRVVSSSTAFSFPWPKRVSPYENHDPDFCTTSRAAATCPRSPKRSIPRPNKKS